MLRANCCTEPPTRLHTLQALTACVRSQLVSLDCYFFLLLRRRVSCAKGKHGLKRLCFDETTERCAFLSQGTTREEPLLSPRRAQPVLLDTDGTDTAETTAHQHISLTPLTLLRVQQSGEAACTRWRAPGKRPG